MTVLVLMPWIVRNSLLLQRFAPLGTQGMMELSAGYSDAAWANDGVWQNLSAAGFFHIEDSEVRGYERELMIAEKSRSHAFTWIRANPGRLPALAARKVYSEFRPRTVLELILGVLMIAGVLRHFRSRTTAVLAGMLLANAVAIGLTWSVEGRFLVPQLFVYYALAAAGLDWRRTDIEQPTSAASTSDQSAR